MNIARTLARTAVLLAAGTFAACSAVSPSPNPPPSGTPSTTYNPTGAIAVPGVPPATGTFSFDISFVDNAAGQYYLADRTTSGIDVISTANQQFIQTAGKGAFTGVVASPPNTSGPNGVLSIGNGILFAGDGNSTLKVLNANTGVVLANIPTVNPYTPATTPAPACGSSKVTSGAGNARVDEMAYDPTDNVVLAINDASCPSFGTFFSTTAPYAILGTVAFPTAFVGGATGVEQPTWDPTQKKFIVAVPGTTVNPGGEVDLVDPNSHAITAVLPVSGCAPNGTALGQNETLFLGCATQELLTINAVTGATVNTISGIGGADEVYYNSASNRFYCGCSNNTSSLGPILAVADGSGNLLSTTGTGAGSHSVAADANDHVYVPERANGIVTFAHQ